MLFNKTKKKRSVLLPFLCFTGGFSFYCVYNYASYAIALYYILIFSCGFCLGGPYNLIMSAITADLGRHPSVMGNRKIVSTVATIIEGTGTLMAGIIQKLIPFFEDYIFYVFTGKYKFNLVFIFIYNLYIELKIINVKGFSIFAGFAFAPLTYKEIKELLNLKFLIYFILYLNFIQKAK